MQLSSESATEDAQSSPVLAEEVIRQALLVTDTIEDASEKAEALLGIAGAQTRLGDLEAARVTLHRALQAALAIKPCERCEIPHPVIRIAQALAEAGDRDSAHRTFLRAIPVIEALDPDPDDESDPVSENWNKLISIQLTTEGQAALRETLEQYRRYLEKNRGGLIWTAYILSALQAKSGDFDGALRNVHESEELRGSARAGLKRWALRAIVEELRDGDQQAAGTVLSEARKAIDETKDLWPPIADDLAAIAKAEARLGWFQEAIATARSIDEGDEGMKFNKALTLIEIATAQAKSGDKVGARPSAEMALQVISTIQKEIYKSYPLELAVKVLARVGDFSGALQASDAAEPSWQRSALLCAIASAQKESGDKASADSTLRQALRCAGDTISAGWVASILADMGDMTAALRTIDSLNSLNDEDEKQKQDFLAGLAVGRAKAGDFKSALNLLNKLDSPRIREQAWIRVASAIPARRSIEDRPPSPAQP